MAYLTWDFPIQRTHCGALFGNGVQGLMVWGDEALHITVGRAGFWDHRGANDFVARATYQSVRAMLEGGDYAALAEAFAVPGAAAGGPPCPTQLGLARLELTFPRGYRPASLNVDTESGIAEIALSNGTATCHLRLRQAMDQELAWLEIPAALAGYQVTLRPSWQWIASQREPLGMSPPQVQCSETGGAMVQTLPEDEPAALAYQQRGGMLVLATALGSDALRRAQSLVRDADVAAADGAADQWWADYVCASARAQFSDARVQEIWDYGLYKQAGLTTPGGCAATLQGPWLEEYQVPPWSCDYHFNINIEMIYWPCLATGHPEHLQPLWDLLRSWLPQLRRAGQGFFGDPEALMLPHAVDDRCRAVGAFWTGCIDSACTAWMAQLAWQYFQHTGDRDFLADLAWPLLHGAFATYWVMLEEQPDGTLALPVSVSPEFRGARNDAWGRNASFQLAACHFLARTLPQAAAVLGEELDPRWALVRDHLPSYSVGSHPTTAEYPEKLQQRIELWQGMDLIESHRHHSHLGAIYPFCTIDPDDPQHAQVVRNSIRHWVRMGPGAWSGWCVPWASILHARCGNGDGALAWLHFWQEHFTNEGRGTLHDAAFYGATTLYQQGAGSGSGDHNGEIMQIEAGQGALHALCELLVQQRGSQIHIHPSPVLRWSSCSFDGIRCPGGVVVGADIRAGQVTEVRIEARRDVAIQVVHGIQGPYEANGVLAEEPLWQASLRAGAGITLRRTTAEVVV